MTFTEQSVLIRELCNGVMFVSSVIVLGLFIVYLVRKVRLDPKGWYQDIAVQAAIALIVLLIGHGVRAGSSWMAFGWLRAGWRAPWWANTAEIFIYATAIILLGKILVVLTFASFRWRWHIALLLVSLSLLVPFAVDILIIHLAQR